MRQFVVTTTDGRAYGLVLDDGPMIDAEVERHVGHFGARLPGDLVAWARFVAGARHGWTLAELVGRDRTFSTGGKARRRYPAASHCRIVAQSNDAAEAA